MPLDIQVKRNLDLSRQHMVTVELTGSLDTATAPELERQLRIVVDPRITDVVFDLAGLKFISSAGLRIFANVRKQLKAGGGHIAFVHMQPQIEEIFAIIKALPGMSIFRNAAEFDTYLTARQLRDREE